LYLTFVFILLLAAFAAYVISPKGSKISLKWLHIPYSQQLTTHLGLDLKGGAYLEYQANLGSIAQNQRSTAMESASSSIERRIYNAGVQEPLVQTQGSDKIIVELPGITNTSQAIQIIGQTPYLEFRNQDPNPNPNQQAVVDASGNVTLNPYYGWTSTGLTGQQLKSASVQFDQSGNPQILLQFDGSGTTLFSNMTGANIGKPIAIFLDGSLLSEPTVQNAITNGQAVITGQFTVQQAKDLATNLNSGALPVPIKLISQQTVGATLGQDSIQKSVVAGMIGLLLIALFMLIYYRLPGLLAICALAIYAMLSFAVFKIGLSVTAVILVGLFFFLAIASNWVFGIFAFVSYFGLMFLGGLSPVTLTLAGIAGFILSIGMAVDANILIFERTKEELRLGKEVSQAVTDGFSRAWPSIRDSNISSLITVTILYTFGTPSIKSFAITLGVGIIISLFTAITVTKTFLRMFVGHNVLVHPWLFGVSKKVKHAPAVATEAVAVAADEGNDHA
jgi:preprotein translocase subunit SecD